MRPVRLVFVTRTSLSAQLFGHTPTFQVAAAMALALGLAAAGSVSWMAWQTQQETRAVQNAVVALRVGATATRQAPHPGDKPALTAAQRRDWNQVTRQLNTPWPAILDALETSTPEDVALVAIEPDTAHANVRLQVEAKTLDTLLAYAQALKTTGPFQDVLLLKHETNDQDAMRPMRLSLDVRLKTAQEAQR